MRIGPLILFEGNAIAAWHWRWSITWRWVFYWSPYRRDMNIGFSRFKTNGGVIVRLTLPILGHWGLQTQENLRRKRKY